MQNGNGQQYEYQKVHQITPEELQKTLVLNLADFEETARYEKMTSKKPALIFALIGIFSIALGFSFPIVESFTAQSKKDDTIVENREEYVEEESENVVTNEETTSCIFDKMNDDGTHIVSILNVTFRDGGIVSFARKTTFNPIPGNGFGPGSVNAVNSYVQQLVTEMEGYSATVQPTAEGGILILANVDYDKLDFTMFPQKNQTHFSTSVEYASRTPKNQVILDLETRGFVCEK